MTASISLFRVLLNIYEIGVTTLETTENVPLIVYPRMLNVSATLLRLLKNTLCFSYMASLCKVENY